MPDPQAVPETTMEDTPPVEISQRKVSERARSEGTREDRKIIREAKTVEVTAHREGGDDIAFEATVRIDTPNEVTYFQNGGILHRVLRDLRSHS